MIPLAPGEAGLTGAVDGDAEPPFAEQSAAFCTASSLSKVT